MKLGNTSQSKVPVPDFFLNNTLKQMETFEISDRKRYFREKDLFRMTKDLNFCNNPRNYNRKHENFNKEKYVPDLTNINSILNNYTTTSKKFGFNDITPKANTFNNFRNFLEKTNVTNFTNPDLRDEIRFNIKVLINKINDEYDLTKWASTDTRSNFLQTNSDNYFTSNNFNSNNTRSFGLTKTEKKFNETDATRFKTILRDKINTMSIDKNLKHKLVKNVNKFNDSTSDKFYKTKTTNIISNLEKNDFMNKENFSKEKYLLTSSCTQDDNTRLSKEKPKFNNTSNNYKSLNRNDLIDINDNFNIRKITLPAVATKYSTVNSDFYNNLTEVEKLRRENKSIYERFKDSTLYRDFPSPDRKEFVIKKGENLRAKTKKDKEDKCLIDFSNYNASKHKHIFCEDYDTNEGVMIKFKKSKEVF